jgi:hypothetical protein
MVMPKPVEAHKRLHRIAGNWVGEEKVHPSPWDPKGGTAIGRVHNRIALDGFVVVQDYEQERSGRVTFRGHGIFTWDEAEQCYALYWFDSMGVPPNIFKGSFENHILTLTTKDAQGHVRTVFDFTQERRYQFRMEVSQNGEQWHTFTEGTYERRD